MTAAKYVKQKWIATEIKKIDKSRSRDFSTSLDN